MSKQKPGRYDDAIEWRPKFSGAELDYYNQLKARYEPRISAIRLLRERLNLTQKELADLLQTTQSNVSKIESKGDPALSVLRRIVEGKGGKLRVIVETPEGDEIDLAA
jgi:DNA-binding XRE family transcriptional regulator